MAVKTDIRSPLLLLLLLLLLYCSASLCDWCSTIRYILLSHLQDSKSSTFSRNNLLHYHTSEDRRLYLHRCESHEPRSFPYILLTIGF